MIKAGFDPNQPRDERGRWTGGAGETNDARHAAPDRPETNASIAQLWLTSFRGSPDLRGDAASPNFNEAGYPGDYHDFLRDHFAEITKAAGGQAITEVPLTGINGVTTRADLLVKPPGASMPFIIEIKTGDDPQYTFAQRQVYPQVLIGGHATSSDPRVAKFGLIPGTPFPPLKCTRAALEARCSTTGCRQSTRNYWSQSSLDAEHENERRIRPTRPQVLDRLF